jgi:hypothetical protein
VAASAATPFYSPTLESEKGVCRVDVDRRESRLLRLQNALKTVCPKRAILLVTTKFLIRNFGVFFRPVNLLIDRVV